MRKILTIAAMLLVAATAQGQSKYDNGHKYGLLSNLEIGVCGIYSYEITNAQHHKNAGAQLLLTKRIGDFWRLRGTAEVNGFIDNGFDRKGKGMVGLSFDLLPFHIPFYIFADYGASLDPSAKSKFGLAMDAGAGLQFKIGKSSGIYFEGGIDRTNNGEKWQSNVEVKAGYIANLGVTEQDKDEIKRDNEMRSNYGTLIQENRMMKSEVQKCAEASATMQAAAEQMQQMVLSLQAENATLKQDNKEIAEKCKNSGFQTILFQTGSSTITVAQDEIIADIAEEMKKNPSTLYKITGYSSASGNIRDNLTLSQERAEAVYNLLIYYDVPEHQLIYSGDGPTDEYKLSDQKVVIERIAN